MTWCATCAEFPALAGRWLDEFPVVQRRIGSRSVAVDVVASGVAGLALLGLDPPKVREARHVWLLVEHLARPGGASMFVSEFVPLTRENLRENHASRSPWAHVDRERRDDLGRAVAQMHRARLRPRTEVPEPEGRGCLLCGVGSVTVRTSTPVREANAWRALSANSRTLGGTASSTVHGHTCPACALAIENAGSIGAEAIQRAVVKHLGVRTLQRLEVIGLEGWGARFRPSPNAQPWTHLGDLKALADRMTNGER
ncbi:MAG: hypothetical protein Q4G64_08825 [bacterium]|nr:hypothetical protein [bacterium]